MVVVVVLVVVVVDEVVVMEAAAVEGAGGKSLRLVNFLLAISRSSLMRCSRVRGGEVVVGVVVVVVVVGVALVVGVGVVVAIVGGGGGGGGGRGKSLRLVNLLLRIRRSRLKRCSRNLCGEVVGGVGDGRRGGLGGCRSWGGVGAVVVGVVVVVE